MLISKKKKKKGWGPLTKVPLKTGELIEFAATDTVVVPE